MRLDLDFPPQLVLHPRLGELALEQNLEGADELALLLAGQIHATELAAAQAGRNRQAMPGCFNATVTLLEREQRFHSPFADIKVIEVPCQQVRLLLPSLG